MERLRGNLPILLIWLAVSAVLILVTRGQIMTGIGVWGLNRTVGWALDITNFVFWVGIGHAGTLISAILFLFRQKWRTAVNRSAEAMTIIAVMCAGISSSSCASGGQLGALEQVEVLEQVVSAFPVTRFSVGRTRRRSQV